MLLAHNDLNTTNSDIQIYQVPGGKKTSATVKIVNRTNGNVKVRLAHSDNATLDASFYILYDHIIYPGDVYTEAIMVLAENEYIFARTDTSGVNVVVYGFEE